MSGREESHVKDRKKVLVPRVLCQNQTLSDLQTLWTAYPLIFPCFTKMLKELLNSFISLFLPVHGQS